MKQSIRQTNAGMTLIEITVVIALILSLITILLVGFNAYKEGADRAKCVLNVSNIQKAVRSFSNLSEQSAGDTVPGWQKTDVMGIGSFIEVEPVCPSNQTPYAYATGAIPLVSVQAAVCADAKFGGAGNPTGTGVANLKTHAPKSIAGW